MPSRPNPLETLLQPEAAVPIVDGEAAAHGPVIRTAYDSPDPVWLSTGDWRIFARALESESSVPFAAEIESFTLPSGARVRAGVTQHGSVFVPFDLRGAFDAYVSESWRVETGGKRLSSGQLDLFYRLKRFIPRSVQLAARRGLIRWQGEPDFPRWPFDQSVVRLLHLYVRCQLAALGVTSLRFAWFWPRGLEAAVILTHDVESADGLRLALDLANLEEERGLRSSFNVVADWYPIDDGILRELRDRGFEIGLHGVHHDRSLFSSRDEFEAQQPALRDAARRFDAVGFRSPATHRVFDWLGDLPVEYDCTIPHSDPFEPQPGGCCSAWPFFVANVVELPYTMPQDHTLLTLLRRRSPEPWLQQLDRLRSVNGLAQCVTHPDPGYLGDADKRAIYAEFLDGVAELDTVWKALPRDVARWWRARRDGGTDAVGVATVEGSDIRLAPLGADA